MPRGVGRFDEARLQGRLWTPALLGKGAFLFWVDASLAYTVTNAGGSSMQWADISGNANNLVIDTNGTSGTYPAYQFNRHQKRGVYFTGGGASFAANRWLKTPTLSIHPNGSYACFAAVSQDTYTSNYGYVVNADNQGGTRCSQTLTMGTDAGPTDSYYSQSIGFSGGSNAADTSAGLLSPVGRPVILGVNRTSALIKVGNNGVVTAGTALGSNNTATDYMTIGQYRMSTLNLPLKVTYVHEILMFKDSISLADERRCYAYLMWKWGATYWPGGASYQSMPPLIGV